MATYSSFKKINTDAFVDGTLTSADISAGQVTTVDLNANAVTAVDFAAGAVTTAKLASSVDLSGKTVTYRTITTGDMADGGVTGIKLGSGASAANFGYTPVNTAGDTMSANLVVAAGSAGAPSVTNASNTATGISFESNAIRIVGGGNEGLVIDNAGRVRRPNHPAWACSATAGWLYASNYGGTGTFELGSVMSWNNASHQTGGSNWNPSNGRYTAPVGGYYVFHTAWYRLNDDNNTPSYVHTFIGRSGNYGIMPGGRQPHNIHMHGNRNNYDDGGVQSVVFSMSAGDYASVFIRWHNYNSRHHAGHHIFSGHMIG
jgi:hypothetical protein